MRSVVLQIALFDSLEKQSDICELLSYPAFLYPVSSVLPTSDASARRSVLRSAKVEMLVLIPLSVISIEVLHSLTHSAPQSSLSILGKMQAGLLLLLLASDLAWSVA